MIEKNAPLISILVNCYNSETYLKEALDSIYAQTYQNFQIILVDNCSTDLTPQIAKEYDDRVTYVRTPSLIPLYAARNVGLNYFKGDYLAFLDSDDIWFPQKLEKQIRIMKEISAPFLYSNYGNIVEHHSSLKKRLIGLYLGLLKINLNFRRSRFISAGNLLKSYDINLQTVIVDKKFLKTNRFNEALNLYGDFEYFLHLILKEKVDAYYVSERLSLSRVHQKQLSRKNTQNWVKEFKICFKTLSPFMTSQQKKDFIKSHFLFHKSNVLVEKNEHCYAWKIKLSLCVRSIPLFMHFLKSSCEILIKKVS